MATTKKRRKRRELRIEELYESEPSLRWYDRVKRYPKVAKPAFFVGHPTPNFFANKEGIIRWLLRKAERFFAREGYKKYGTPLLYAEKVSYGSPDTESCYCVLEVYGVPQSVKEQR